MSARAPSVLESESTATLWRLAFIGGTVAATAIAHHVTPVESVALHNIYQRLYYLPIFAAAFWFGLRGAVATSLLSAASYLPHIIMDWGGLRGVHDEYMQAQYAELVMFQVVAVVVGLLAESERRSRERQERTATELAEAYNQLQESFEQLRRADRLTALGELSAGLAHEIKNPLASIKASLDILFEELSPEDEKREFADIVHKELNQLEHIVEEFLQFARTPKLVREPCDLREVADSLKTLCSKEASRHAVTIEIESAPGLPNVRVDAPQLQQALLNVVLNGIQSMPSGGTLTIELDDGDDRVVLRVRDDGPGVPAELRARIFEPFFTTKARGSGLGLAIARKLIEAQGGQIHLDESTETGGACFVITLPKGDGDDA
jgi:signal transduction histidine kinase